MKPKANVHAIVLASVGLAAGLQAPAAARASANAYGGHTNKCGTSDYLLGSTVFKPAYSATSVYSVGVAAP